MKTIKNLGKILYNLKEIEKELGIDLYLFYLPTHTWKSNEEIITFIKNKNVKIIDLYNELYKNRIDGNFSHMVCQVISTLKVIKSYLK